MTSINYNSAATTALRTLQQTNSALETSQNRVSTGLKIGEAKDNAAYWSISTTLKSDNKALATVSDALGLGAATVDVAYQGLNKSLEVINEIKSKLTSASQEGVDKAAVQSEISQLQQQLTSISNSSSFSGENWLSPATGSTSLKSVVSSFNRGVDGAVTLGTIQIDTSTTALINAGNGILDTTALLAEGTFKATVTSTITPTATQTVDADGIAFTVKVGTGAAIQVTINLATVNAALGTASAGEVATSFDYAAVLNQGLKDSKVTGVKATVDSATGGIVFTADQDFDIGIAAAVGASTLDPADFGLATAPTVAATNPAGAFSASVLTLNITNVDGSNGVASKAQIEAMIDLVNSAANGITAAAATLGAVSSRIELQSSFVDSLTDTIDKGVSGLIDADLSEESTRLQALQTKQQLGIQALSIANSSTQNILSLFRS